MELKHIEQFMYYLKESEHAKATMEKYRRDLTAFCRWLDNSRITKETVLQYKAYLTERYAPASVNSMLSALNSFFMFYSRSDLCVKTLKLQRVTYLSEERELTVREYGRLVRTARKHSDEGLCWIMQTICAIGIRVSELRFITAEAVEKGYAEICCKGKRRRVYLPDELCRYLKQYLRKHGIKKGPVFLTDKGKPVSRTSIWMRMKRLCREAEVSAHKVFPHNLRHLFARMHYAVYKDIVRLADILGHGSVNTTRIYTMESGVVQRKQINGLGLVIGDKGGRKT